MKTIFVTSFNPFISRNILQNESIFSFLTSPGVKSVVFCPDYKRKFFEENFSGGNIIIEGIFVSGYTWREKVFSYLARSLIDTSTLAIHRLEILDRSNKFMNHFLSRILAGLGRFSFVKNIARKADLFSTPSWFNFYFEKYKPDIVFATDVFNVTDVRFLAEAKSKNIKTVGMVRSWDNITNKGLMRIKPDKLIVHNEVIMDEAVKYGGFFRKNIFLSGLPQFDIYFEYRPNNRNLFFERLGLDPSKKTVLFAPAGRRFYDGDRFIFNILREAITSGRIENAQLLVRFPPNDYVVLGDYVSSSSLAIDIPGQSFNRNVFRDKELNREDARHLADSLCFIDVVVSYNSTICIDASVFGKPIITIAFDGDGKRSYLKSARRFLDFEHVRKFLATGCAKIARSKFELIDYINYCLQNPEADMKNRQKLLTEQVWRLDGKSGQRIADFLASFL